MRFLLGVIVFLIPLQVSAAEEVDPDHYLDHYYEAQASRQSGDQDGWRDHLEAGLSLWENLPGVQYELAEACALTGRPDRALELLEESVRQGYANLPDTSASFASLLEMPRFKKVSALLAANLEVVSSSAPAFTLPRNDFFPEGITWDPDSGDFFAGSLAGNQIVRWTADGASSLLVDDPQEDVWPILGIKVQAERGRLWACRQSGTDSSATALFVYDLSDGHLVARYPALGPDEHFLNDLALTADGTAYVSDSAGNRLWKITPGEEELSYFLPVLRPFYPNGIALSPDEQFLYVGHYFGLLRIELKTGQWTRLKSQDGQTLAGIDGLSWYQDSLISLHNGTSPRRVCRLRLAPDYSEVVSVEVLERGNPLFKGIPTTGVVAGDEYHFLANSQMRLLGDDHLPTDRAALDDAVILKIPLRK